MLCASCSAVEYRTGLIGMSQATVLLVLVTACTYYCSLDQSEVCYPGRLVGPVVDQVR